MKEQKNLNLQLFAEDEPAAEPQSAEEYVAAINALKAKTVSKEDYDKLVAEKSVLVRTIAEGATLPESEKSVEKKPNIKELRKKILNAGEDGLSNAEFVETALELRAACLEEGLPDPFLPLGIKRKPDNEDFAGAEKVAEAFQSMLDESRDDEGKVDPETFNFALKKTIANDSPLLNAKLKQAARKK